MRADYSGLEELYRRIQEVDTVLLRFVDHPQVVDMIPLVRNES
jgi:hypothetical protein